MKHRYVLLALVGALSIGVFAGTGLSEESAPSPEDMMKEHFKVHTPGPFQKLIAGFAGTWDTETSMWWGPGEPSKSTGKSVNTMTCGGRFLKQAYSGSMMNMPLKGEALLGHDNYGKRFQMTWHDQMTTSISVYEGPSTADAKAIVVRGVMNSPQGKMTDQWTYTFEGADKVVAVRHMGAEGATGDKLKKNMQIVYTRAKKEGATK